MKNIINQAPYELKGGKVDEMDSALIPALGFLEDMPTQLMRFDDVVNAAARITNIVVSAPLIGAGPIKFQMHVQSNNVVTSTATRPAKWTGFNAKVRLFDGNELLVMEWDLGQVNFSCVSDFYHVNQSNVGGSVFTASLLFSAYSYHNC